MNFESLPSPTIETIIKHIISLRERVTTLEAQVELLSAMIASSVTPAEQPEDFDLERKEWGL